MHLRYAEGTARLQAALQTAAQMREATAAEAAQHDRDLARREDALRAVDARLRAQPGPAGAGR